MKKLLIVLVTGLFAITAIAVEMSYDNLSITPQTWEEIDLSYTTMIDGKKYTEQANLLRPIYWIQQNHLNKAGSMVHLTKEQLGIDADVKVVAIKPTNLNYSSNNHINSKPVIAAFIAHTKEVWDYTFKDQYEHQETVQAGSNHPFYSLDRHSYIPIGQLKFKEHVKSNNGKIITLISKRRHNTGIESVHNFEVYQTHNYTISKYGIIVHNPCKDADRVTLLERAKTHGTGGTGDETGRYGFTIENIYMWGSHTTIPEDMIVMRGAEEIPTDAFERGLMPTKYSEEVNDNLVAHLTGTKKGTQWVSTTSNFDTAVEYAKNKNGYIYIIYADKEYTVDAMETIEDINPNFAYDYSYNYERELSHLGRIPRENILGAFRYDEVPEYFIKNPNFSRDVSRINIDQLPDKSAWLKNHFAFSEPGSP